MKTSHVTLRLPRELARALTRWARERGVAKSHVVREAVAAYLSAGPAAAPRPVSAAALAERWSALPRLTPEEAATLADDIAAAREGLPAPGSWE